MLSEIISPIFSFIVAFVFDVVCHYLGTRFLRIITFGKYPPGLNRKEHKSGISWVGFAVLIGLLVAFSNLLSLILD